MKYTNIKFAIYTLFIGILLATQVFAITKTDLETPSNSVEFGKQVVVLPNGNIVVTDPEFSNPGGAQRVGAVYMFDGDTRQLLSTIKGSTANDRVGQSGIIVLENGNFLIISPRWNNGSALEAGAVTFVLATTTSSFVVSSSNSLVGTQTGDQVGLSGVQVLAGQRYIVSSYNWDNGSVDRAGAITYCRFSLGCRGAVSSSNSLVGVSENDFSSGRITVLTNGNFVFRAPNWANGGVSGVGAVTFVNSSTGISGVISASNSLIGSTASDNVGINVTALENGNYVVTSEGWQNSSGVRVGAATFGNGTSGIIGTVSQANSLIGSSDEDFGDIEFGVGSRVIPLPNGNYLVNTPGWDNGVQDNAGASTFGNGTTGITGVISSNISLVGSNAEDNVGRRTTVLSNGNYVVRSPNWRGGQIGAGAATFGNGTTGVNGIVSSANSLIGSRRDDNVGWSVTALANGNYVVVSPFWDNGFTTSNAGAVTFGNGTTGITGSVTTQNSLIGSNEDDFLGSRPFANDIFPSVWALTNGNYVVISGFWDNGGIVDAGAATFASGTSPITGTISPSNSLVGSTADDFEFVQFEALTNGNYVIGNLTWDNGAIQDAGAATFGNGVNGVTGVISPSNSLVGTKEEDFIGRSIFVFPNGDYGVYNNAWDNGSQVNTGAFTFGDGQTGTLGTVSSSNSFIGDKAGDLLAMNMKVLANGNYVLQTNLADNGSIVDAGAITYIDADSGIIGKISATNSLFGETPNVNNSIRYSLNETNDELVVGRPLDNKVTIISLTSNTKTKFDFDGDSKSDVSIFRPAPAEWWFLRSSDGGNNAFQFGQTSDTLVPADYTGDGITDVAFWRESTGEWFVLRSEDSSFYSFPFGANGDIPAPGDFDGDGKDDVAVYRSSSGTWFINRSSDGNTDIIGFGVSEDKPVVADYDGDGKADIGIYRPSNSQWWINRSTDGLLVFQFGQAGDKTVQGDYTGDGKADVAFWRPSSGEWFVIRSEDQTFFGFPFGANGDVPIPGDYDGDGKQDAAVFRPSNTTWFLNGSTSGTQILGFGANGDIPLPNAFVYE